MKSKNGRKRRKKDIKSVIEQYPIAMWDWPRIAVFVPQFPAMPYADKVFYGFIRIAQFGAPFIELPYMRTDMARCKAAEEIIKDERYTHILMLDADHIHPHNIIQRLAKWVVDDPDKLVVGGLNFRRCEPFDPCAFVSDGNGGFGYIFDWEPGLIEVDMIGTGSILIHRSVFETIDKPWFYYDYEKVNDDSWPGVDLGFSKKCMKAGIQIYCDTTTVSPHMTEALVAEVTYRNYWEKKKDELQVLEVQ